MRQFFVGDRQPSHDSHKLQMPGINSHRLRILSLVVAAQAVFLAGCSRNNQNPSGTSYVRAGLSANPVAKSMLQPGSYFFAEIAEPAVFSEKGSYLTIKRLDSESTDRLPLLDEAVQQKLILSGFKKGDLIIIPEESAKNGNDTISVARLDFARVVYRAGYWSASLTKRLKDGHDDIRSAAMSMRIKELYWRELGLPETKEAPDAEKPTGWFFAKPQERSGRFEKLSYNFFEVAALPTDTKPVQLKMANGKILGDGMTLKDQLAWGLEVTSPTWQKAKKGDLILLPIVQGEMLRADGTVASPVIETMLNDGVVFFKKGEWSWRELKSPQKLPDKYYQRFLGIYGPTWKEKIHMKEQMIL